MASAFDVSALSDYVEQKKDLLIKDLVFSKGYLTRFGVQTGIKTKAMLHSLDLATYPELITSNSTCGFNPAGKVTISEREIEVANLKVNLEFCDKDLLGTYAEYLVKFGAGNEELPFEEYILQAVTDQVNRAIERAFWNGEKGVGLWGFFDGVATILANAYDDGEDVAAYEYQEGDTAYDKILGVYSAAPDELLERNDVEIYVGPAIFREFMQNLVTKNLYHYNPGDGKLTEIMLPGANAKVVMCPGLAQTARDGIGQDFIVCTHPGNIIYGTDMEGDEEQLKAWYSEDDDMFRVKATWNSGVQVAFLDRCVIGFAPSIEVG